MYVNICIQYMYVCLCERICHYAIMFVCVDPSNEAEDDADRTTAGGGGGAGGGAGGGMPQASGAEFVDIDAQEHSL